MTLESWFLFSIPVTRGDDFDSCERASVLGGQIYNHPLHPNGAFFISEPLIAANKAAGVVATRSGIILTLGKVSGSNEMIFPGIRDYVLTGLPQDPTLAPAPATPEPAKV